MSSELFNPGKFNIDYEDMIFSYQSEIDRFIDIFQTQYFRDIFKLYKSENTKNISKSQLFKTPSNILKRGLITFNNIKDKNIESALAFSQISSSCHMLNGQSIPINNLKHNFSSLIAKAIVDHTIKSHGDNAYMKFVGDIHISDSVRIIRFLQISGFIKPNKETCQQLSLGCFAGIRDLNAIHSKQKLLESSITGPVLGFKSTLDHAKHTVLIDPDESLVNNYRTLNESSSDHVLAINDYADSGLKFIAKKINNNELKRRNLIISLRIDHRMIPDEEVFFKLIGNTIDDSADLVMSFGAGDTPDQFSGRINAFNSIEKHLKSLGMSPVRIRMYDDSSSSIIDHRIKPLFGIFQFSSHEVLYCKLKRKMLTR